MHQVIDNLWVGSDTDFLKVKDRKDFSVLRCCKEGPGGHRETVGYSTQAAPKGDKYLSASAHGRHLALNFIDPNDPNFIPPKMIEQGIAFIGKRLAAGDKVLVACNAGHSRGPTTAMLYLRSVDELVGNFIASERVFRTLYPDYEPGIGMRTFARNTWNTQGKQNG